MHNDARYDRSTTFFLTGSKCPENNRHSARCHITPLLRELHWPPVMSRIDNKILIITVKAIYGTAPKYISDLVT